MHILHTVFTRISAAALIRVNTVCSICSICSILSDLKKVGSYRRVFAVFDFH